MRWTGGQMSGTVPWSRKQYEDKREMDNIENDQIDGRGGWMEK